MRDHSRCALLERECAGARNTYCVCDHRSLRGATPSRRALYLQGSVHRAALAGRDPPFVAHRRQASTAFPSRASHQFIPERSTERQGPLNDKRTQLVPMCPVGTNAVAPISRSSVSRGAHMPRCAPHQPVLALPNCSTCSRVTLCEGPLPKSDVFTPVTLIKRESGSAGS